MENKKRKLVVPEEALMKIMARFSLKRIARFRSVCKEWKSMIDSDFFRDFYESLNSSSSSSVSWSIMNRRNNNLLSLEIIGHHGCHRWGLTNSLGSLMRYNPETTVRKTSVLSCTDGLVLIYTETSEGSPMYHVGTPLLQQWVRIPLPPHLSAFDVVRLQENTYFSDTGLVTKMEKGIVASYKVVWVLAPSGVSKALTFMIYSSETRLWKTEKVRCLRPLIWSRLKYSVPLNGILHWLAAACNDLDANYVVSYDFFSGGDANLECRVIPFPGVERFERKQRFKRTITTSAGFVMYCNVFGENGGRTIRVWRLVKYADNDPQSWQLSWKLNTKSSLVGFGADYFPVVMHPFNSDIIYMWSRNKNGLVLLNLRTHKFSLHKEESLSEDEENKSMDGCIMTLSGCKEYMDSVYELYANNELGAIDHTLYFSQYVLPRWLNPLPQLSS